MNYRKVSPLFFLVLSLLMIIHPAQAIFGDAQLGHGVAESTQATTNPFGLTDSAGATLNVLTLFVNNTLGNGFISGIITYIGDGINFCGNTATAIAVFPTGYNPVGLGQSYVSPNQVYKVTQLVSNAPCNSGSAGGLSGSEASIPQQTFVALGQWVGIVLFDSNAVSGNQDGGGWQCKGNSAPSRGTLVDQSNSASSPVVGQSITSSSSGASCNTPAEKMGGLDITFSSGGSATGAQCIGNCQSQVSTNSTHTINFNQSQTIFYLQQVVLQNALVVNVTTVVAKNYQASFGLTLYIALYATSGQCPSPLDAPFSSRCPGLLIQQKSFPNPQKGIQIMQTQLSVVAGSWIAPAFSASRSGLDLNDTTTTVSSDVVNGIMPSVITSFVVNGPIKTNLQANLISTTGIPFPKPTCPLNSDLACFEVASICALAPSNCMIGGVVYLAIYMILWFAGITILSAYLDREAEIKIELPASLHLLIFIIFLTSFTILGIFPLYLIVLEFLVVSVLFASTLGGLAGRGRES